MPPRISLTPPLLNSATPWATTVDQLAALYDCPHTGAVTTRTTLPAGFAHDDRIHQHAFFGASSLNTYGYSPHALAYYLDVIAQLVGAKPQRKPFIVSLGGPAASVAAGIQQLAAFAAATSIDVWAELNLSCPNLPSRPPPAYSSSELAAYLALLPHPSPIPVGIKTPPFTHAAQFDGLVAAVAEFPNALAFVTATNTLGGCLHLSPSDMPGTKKWQPTLASEAGTGVGGLAGEAIHWLSLGNVATLRRALDAAGLADVAVIGVGGVGDREGMERMLSVGAAAVGVGTALGREGIDVFASILAVESEGTSVAEVCGEATVAEMHCVAGGE